ncbi:hypothetical protein BAUCODRAFT_28182 [Baudoinia panamericana UAMH 10762]|uniref:G-protein coupled receptors family 1 profile domain-containing protein n=1 Tax=Baudoinia panamericana (strain UAMH 10762) TaxID=717646 RepID=M2M5R3_BAUPA|nr:uncharacterized protein BAUCODRAFT_28182 [Baudoinia panamericana UAMH 10762]EMC91971.1 hypothetical protein BAUCODRAFT_28182 [Baudoinia panamericana UAMH 10762]
MPSIPSTVADLAVAIANSTRNSSHVTITPGPETLHLQLARHASPGIDNANSVNTSLILASHERHEIQLMATITSSVSVLAALCALYWFYMMRRNFRRDLVLMLICADFWKSLWYLIYTSNALAHGQAISGSKLCQASGYLLQIGIESCAFSSDVAILLMSLHLSLQIFPPKDSFLGHDGLYRIRYLVVVAWIIIPNISASLAFVNPRLPYVATGAFCYLPIRPYWYRIALSWAPRYLIWLYIMFVAIRIYRHVGKEFEVFGAEKDRSSSVEMPGRSAVATVMATQALATIKLSPTPPTFDADLEKQVSNEEDVAPDDTHVVASESTSFKVARSHRSDSTPSLAYPSSRRPSGPNWSTAFGFPVEPLTGPVSTKSASNSRRGSRQIAAGVMAEDFAPASTPDLTRHRGSIVTLSSMRSHTQSIDSAHVLPPIKEDKRTSASTEGSITVAQNAATSPVDVRRRAIQRQLRLLFIYPVIYIILWTVPFIFHCFDYSDHYAQHPIFQLSAVNTFCQCFLGFADVCVFCWREKPWRHVPGSDGTFLGSLCFWRFCFQEEWVRRESKAPQAAASSDQKAGIENAGPAQSQTGLIGAIKRFSLSFTYSPRSLEASNASAAPSSAGPPGSIVHRRTRSGGSDRKQMEIEHAHRRLALERKDYEAQRRSLNERRASVISMQQSAEGGKEWWERHHQDALREDVEPKDGGQSGGGRV